MKIVPIEFNFQTLYENRHLFTDDVQYNSLIVSNLFNLNIILITIKDYDVLEYDHKKQIYREVIMSYKYILSRHGVYVLKGYPYTLVFYNWQKPWQEFQSQWVMIYHQRLSILTIVE